MLKKLILIAGLIYIITGIWFNATYNWPPPVEPVTFKTYKISTSSISDEWLKSWEEEARNIKGVTALSLNRESEILAVSVNENHLLDNFIERSNAQNEKLEIKAVEIASDNSGGCPYHQTLDRISFLFKWPFISQSY